MAKTASANSVKSGLGGLEKTLEVYLVDKAPFQLPDGAKEFMVKYGPWIILVLLVLSLPALLLAFGLGTLVAPFAFLGGLQAGVTYGVGMIFSVVVLVMEALALPGLFGRKMSGWRMMFYATLVGAVQNVITFSLGGLVIGTLLSLYILFQIKSYYK